MSKHWPTSPNDARPERTARRAQAATAGGLGGGEADRHLSVQV